MQFGKRTFFLALNGIVALLLLLYAIFWLLGSNVEGQVLRPLQSNVVVVKYNVQGIAYTKSFMRNDIPFAQYTLTVRFQKWDPTFARIQSFMGLWAEPLAWWLVFLLASAMLLLTNNTVFSKGTRFQLHQKFPWLTMDEFFPAGDVVENSNRRGHSASAIKKLPDGWR